MPRPVEELRKVVNVRDAAFRPYDLYGAARQDMSWCNVSYDEESGQGAFFLRFAPGARSFPHEHTGFEEFLVLEGELTDSDGRVFEPGDFVSMRPGSRHWSVSQNGVLLLVIFREGSGNRRLGPGEEINLR